ncbi:hypothetical protein [Flavilitoribacter nigricans]|uniref:Uncharacterized protein n=1 Tax=Flavilitoribacter nigricans (strain ATCC 23147 / DSM 23189 / NBRC 102662 / NCIMB 1420 / SS-2) TaxID=1122177 RepID=A0A2D0MZ17_FLAN2|nr:hypothetical protein [Flavilitoribacter nigricans]PHN01129.1 hypothetical protein CRP01_38650 [Flavilitoribacter nigricans DSM 23189 = NBRC 102662]
MKNTNGQVWIFAGSAALVLASGAYLLWWHPKRKTQRNLQDVKGNPAPDMTTKPTSTAVVTEPNWQDPFDMQYAKDVLEWVAPRKILALNTEKAKLLAKQIKAAKGAWYSNDNEQAVASVFAKQLKDKVQVANLSQAFWQLYKTDMWEYLNGFLSSKEMEKYVHEPVRKLADYRIA